MNAMVTARVPVEIKKQGDRKLKEIGSSATELVNAAYKYVLEHGHLPGETTVASEPTPQVKTLSGEMLRSYREKWSEMAVLDSPSYDGSNFKELLDRARDDRYARFA